VDAFILDQSAFGNGKQKKNVDIGDSFYCRFRFCLFSVYVSMAQFNFIFGIWYLDQDAYWHLALAGGGYSIKEFIFNKDSGCKVAGDEKRQKTFERLKLAVQQNSLWLALGGIVVLAFAVNLVELICSAGLPAVYTQVLALNEMAGWQYYSIFCFIFSFSCWMIYLSSSWP
jgi:hypothetical protein